MKKGLLHSDRAIFYANLAENDKRLSARIADDQMSLMIGRNGQKFSAQLRTADSNVSR
jgi:transcription antitermination factor NusA-like protein